MGGQLSVDECTSTDNPRVRDCCHLEGETPIEIRIAYQQPRPAAQPISSEGAGPWDARAGLANLGHGAAHFAAGPPHSVARSSHWQSPGSMDAEKPPMPRGTERLRLPPPAGGGVRTQPRTPASQASTSDFDAETFAAPPDSERSEVAATPGRMQQPVALQMLQFMQDEDYFPEIVRVSTSRQAPSTFREVATDRSVPDTQRSAAEYPAAQLEEPAPSERASEGPRSGRSAARGGGAAAPASERVSERVSEVAAPSPKTTPPATVRSQGGSQPASERKLGAQPSASPALAEPPVGAPAPLEGGE
mmetsp:Transcript_31466/g.68599  ORF Transcript_31466/g.68599 Transcript_31466/m.68599 type:complete len:304 (-) Transcript_31466:95-1006(-)